jgi:tetratricopeptide (TPR) repeat protein
LASRSYRGRLLLAPDSATLHLAYAANFLLIPDGVRAETQARRSLELWPDNAEAHETLRIFPEHTSAKFQFVVSCVKNRQYDEALPAIRNALVVLPGVPALHKFLGICLLQKKQTADAIDQLTW